MKSRHSHSLLLVIGCVTITALAIAYGFLHYRIATLTDHAAQTQAVFAGAGPDGRPGSGLVNLFRTTTASRARLESLFVKESTAVSFIEALEAVGPQSNVKVQISSITPAKFADATPGAQGILRAHLETQGSWDSVMKVLMLVELLPYQVSISNARFDMIQGGNTRQWKLSIDVEAVQVAGLQ